MHCISRRQSRLDQLSQQCRLGYAACFGNDTETRLGGSIEPGREMDAITHEKVEFDPNCCREAILPLSSIRPQLLTLLFWGSAHQTSTEVRSPQSIALAVDAVISTHIGRKSIF